MTLAHRVAHDVGTFGCVCMCIFRVFSLSLPFSLSLCPFFMSASLQRSNQPSLQQLASSAFTLRPPISLSLSLMVIASLQFRYLCLRFVISSTIIPSSRTGYVQVFTIVWRETIAKSVLWSSSVFPYVRNQEVIHSILMDLLGIHL